MKRKLKSTVQWACAVAMLSVGCRTAHNIAGDWQSVFYLNQGGHLVLRITDTGQHVLKASIYNVDDVSVDGVPDEHPVSSIAFRNSTLRFSSDYIHASYEGKMSADGNSIAGTWRQGFPVPVPQEFQRATRETAWKIDSSPHTQRFVPVDKDVQDEVLDWGGSGRPLVLLAGLGNTAHIFDKFAPKLIAKYHVYGITRRGFGSSSSPLPNNENYSSDRLADDVIAVIDSLDLKHAVVVGHSIAGEKLSSIGSRNPEKVAGLIYLDAGYPYALYDSSRGDLQLDSIDMQNKLAHLTGGPISTEQKQLIQGLILDLPRLERDLRQQLDNLQAMPSLFDGSTLGGVRNSVPAAILAGVHKYTHIDDPCLAIFANPPDSASFAQFNDRERTAFVAWRASLATAKEKAFKAEAPSCRVVRIPDAIHLIFMSNEADVLREIDTFVASFH